MTANLMGSKYNVWDQVTDPLYIVSFLLLRICFLERMFYSCVCSNFGICDRGPLWTRRKQKWSVFLLLSRKWTSSGPRRIWWNWNFLRSAVYCQVFANHYHLDWKLQEHAFLDTENSVDVAKKCRNSGRGKKGNRFVVCILYLQGQPFTRFFLQIRHVGGLPLDWQEKICKTDQLYSKIPCYNQVPPFTLNHLLFRFSLLQL